MRITQLANFYNPTSGGLRTAVDRLADGYRAAGHDVRLIVPGPRGSTTDAGATIKAPALPNGSGYRVIVSRQALLRAVEASAPDLVECHDRLLARWVAPWCRRRGLPIVAFSHERLDAVLAQFAGWLPRRARAFVSGVGARQLVRSADLLVVCSRFAAAEYGDAANVRSVPLGVDLERFRPGVVHGGRIQLVCVSRLSTEKRPDLAVECVRELVRRGVDIELEIVGAGPRLGALRERAAGLPVSFAGFLPTPAIANRLAGADLALVPGPAETFGLAALEALASGTAIVTVDGAGPSEFIGAAPSAGRRVAPDTGAFADAVESLLALPPAERSRAAREVALGYDWQHTVSTMLGLHGELVSPELKVNE
jgi:alpha-1,6-mannosyltransferase